MKKFYKITGIAIGICFAIGLTLAIIGGAMGATGVIALTKEHGFQILDNMDRYNHKDMSMDAFNSICIDTKTADVNVVASKDGKYGVDISLIGDESTVQLVNEGGVLTIKDTASELGFMINLSPWTTSFDNTITIYVPTDVYLDRIEITCNAGDIDIQKIKGAKQLSIVGDLGDIDVNKGTFETVNIEVNAGDVTMDNIEISSSLEADMDMGDFEIIGHITGDVYVETNMGDIDMKIGESLSDYRYDISMNVGDIEAFGQEREGFDGNISGNPDGQYYMNLKTNMGDITVH